MDLPITLPNLAPHSAIADALYRCVQGLDTASLPLFLSAWTLDRPSATFTINETTHHGLDESIIPNIFNSIGPLVTTHMISNIRISMEAGAEEAQMTAYALATHWRRGEGMEPGREGRQRLTSGSRYRLDVMKDGEGLWRIREWKMEIVWLEGDMSIVMP